MARTARTSAWKGAMSASFIRTWASDISPKTLRRTASNRARRVASNFAWAPTLKS